MGSGVTSGASVLRLGVSVAAATTVLASCSSAPESLPVGCEVVRSGAVTPADTVYVDVELDEPLAPDATLRTMVRVEPLDEPGAVTFQGPISPSTAAVSATLIPGDAFHGCLGEAPQRFRLRAPRAPRDRVWVRVSADRPVTLRLSEDGRAVDGTAPLTVLPGASGEARWNGQAGGP